MLISEIYRKKPKTISPDTTVKEALRKLIEEDINALIVVSDNDRVMGVLSLQDIAAATVPTQFKKNIRMASAMYRPGFFTDMCQEVKDKKITSIMRREFIKVGLEDNIMAVTADFLKNDLYIVPVLDKGKLVGVITRSEIREALVYGMRTIKED